MRMREKMPGSEKIVTVDGERLGDLIAVGDGFMFFTTHQQLLDMDGRVFGDFDDLRKEISRNRNKRIRRAA